MTTTQTIQQQRIADLCSLGYTHVSGIAGVHPAVHLVKHTASGRYGAQVARTGHVTTTRPRAGW